jgi:hypothetical protein
MTSDSCRTRICSPLLVAAIAAACLAAPVPAAAQTGAPAVPALERAQAWQKPDESLAAPARGLVTEAAPHAGRTTRLGVVSVREVDGRPEIVVEQTRGRAEAISAVEEAQGAQDVLAVAVDTRAQVSGLSTLLSVSGTDPERASQWALDRLSAEKVWAEVTGTGAVVAVVDSGVDGNHPDLSGQLTDAGADFVAGSGNGRVDPNGHGTHVAGIVAAVQGNGIGVAGLAPRARVMPVRVLDENGAGWMSDIARGVTYAVDNGADVVNLSLGGTSADPVLKTALEYARSSGVIAVAAVGNQRQAGSPTSYPAAFPGVVGVASTDSGDASSSFSNRGSYVDVAAPGGSIRSTYPGGTYATWSGTSMATPYVAALAALAIDGTDGALTPARFDEVLIAHAEDLGAEGWDDEFGHGLIAPYATVCTLVPCTSQPTTGDDEETDTAPPGRQQVNLRFTRGGGRAVAGQRKPVAVRLVSETGKPVAGQRVVVVAHRGRKVVARRVLTTNDRGRAVTRFRIPRTTRFTVRSPQSETYVAARSGSSIRWQAVPRVRVDRTAKRVAVRVVHDRGQRVRFQKTRGSRWVTLRVRRLDGRGRAVVRGLSDGRWRAQVTAANGLAPTRTAAWRVR